MPGASLSRLFVSLFLLWNLLLQTGCGGVSSPPPALLRYRNSNLVFSISYPHGWKLREQASNVTFSQSDSNAVVTVSSLPAGIFSTPQVLDYFLKALHGQLSNYTETGGQHSRIIAGHQWEERDATFTSNRGTSGKLTALAVQTNKRIYIISLVAASFEWKEDDKHIFSPMLESFTFHG